MNLFKIDWTDLNVIRSKMKLVVLRKKPLIIFAYLATLVYVIVFFKIQTMFGMSNELENFLKSSKRKINEVNLFSRIFEDEAKNLYLNDKYLRLINLAFENIDSKSIVDRATKMSLNTVLTALNKLDVSDLDQIRKFASMYFHEPGYEIVKAEFTDWKPSPKYIDNISNPSLKKFSLALNDIWKDLYKKLDLSLLNPGAVSSHLPIKNPFVVPGGRFLGKKANFYFKILNLQI